MKPGDLNKDKIAQDRANEHFPSKIKSEILETSLFDIIKTCKKNNVNIIGVKFPKTKTYYNQSQYFDYHADSLFFNNKIDVSNIANGLYIVRFTNNNSNKSTLKKVIISK